MNIDYVQYTTEQKTFWLFKKVVTVLRGTYIGVMLEPCERIIPLHPCRTCAAPASSFVMYNGSTKRQPRAIESAFYVVSRSNFISKNSPKSFIIYNVALKLSSLLLYPCIKSNNIVAWKQNATNSIWYTSHILQIGHLQRLLHLLSKFCQHRILFEVFLNCLGPFHGNTEITSVALRGFTDNHNTNYNRSE